MNQESFKTSERILLWPMLVGFYFAFRLSITFLWFQADPVVGSAVNIAVGLMLLAGTVFYTVGTGSSGVAQNSVPITVKFVWAFLGLALISVTWTVTQSYTAALGYWVGLFTDVAMTWFIALYTTDDRMIHSILKGFVSGAGVVAVIAWIAPTTSDLRLGNDDFMHPNLLGWEFALSTLFSQYLSRWQAAWKWAALTMAIIQVRTLSKTALLAFAIAETFYVLHDAKMSRQARVYIGLVATTIIVCFWGWLETYAEIYASEGNSPETLTGRTILWAVTFSMALEQPWLGHGIHSFRALIPARGTFEPWHAHNEILHQFFVYGATGVIIGVGMYWSFYRQVRRSPTSDLRTLALAVLIMSLIRGLTDTDRFDFSFPLWLFTLMSIYLANKGNYSESSYK